MKQSTATLERNLLIGLLVFLGLGALIGGVLLMLDPSGKLLGEIPLAILNNSPFSGFFFPGLILLMMIGVAPCFVAWALWTRANFQKAELLNLFPDMHWSWSFSIYIAFILMIWMQVETIYAQSVNWLQTFYMLYPVPMIILALRERVRKLYKK